MAFDPGRDIDEQREARRMAFGKTIFAEALDLVEAALRESKIISVPCHAGDEFLAEQMDGAIVPKGRHGAPQAVRLVGREPGGRDGDLHRLLLEERHAERSL